MNILNPEVEAGDETESRLLPQEDRIYLSDRKVISDVRALAVLACRSWFDNWVSGGLG